MVFPYEFARFGARQHRDLRDGLLSGLYERHLGFLCVAAAPSLGVNSLNELVKLAATKPGELNAYAVPGAPHLA